MGVDQSRVRRQQLIEQLRATGVLTDQAVARAFRNAPREFFLPGVRLDEVYQDQAIVTKESGGVPISSSSQPAIMSLMLQQLDARPGMQVLEVGAGTGYNAALLQELVTSTGRVVTVEIDPEIACWAEERLCAAGYPQVTVVCGDGAEGYPPVAPYDRVQLTVGVADIARDWVEQLRPGGILVLPLWVNSAQVSVALEKGERGLRSRSLEPCGFMRIRGRLAGRDRFVPLSDRLMVASGSPDLSLDLLRGMLEKPGGCQSVPVSYSPGWSFTFWLALRGDRVLGVFSREGAAGYTGAGFGLFIDQPEPSVALLVLPETDAEAADLVWYGAPGARDRLLDELERWHEAGEPTTSDFQLEVRPHGGTEALPPDQVAVDTPHWRLLFRLPGAVLAPTPRLWNNR